MIHPFPSFLPFPLISSAPCADGTRQVVEAHSDVEYEVEYVQANSPDFWGIRKATGEGLHQIHVIG